MDKRASRIIKAQKNMS